MKFEEHVRNLIADEGRKDQIVKDAILKDTCYRQGFRDGVNETANIVSDLEFVLTRFYGSISEMNPEDHTSNHKTVLEDYKRLYRSYLPPEEIAKAELKDRLTENLNELVGSHRYSLEGNELAAEELVRAIVDLGWRKGA